MLRVWTLNGSIKDHKTFVEVNPQMKSFSITGEQLRKEVKKHLDGQHHGLGGQNEAGYYRACQENTLSEETLSSKT